VLGTALTWGLTWVFAVRKGQLPDYTSVALVSEGKKNSGIKEKFAIRQALHAL
jgi:hypothetical protein